MASAIVLGIIVCIAVLFWIFSGKSNSSAANAETTVYYVNSRGGGVTSTSIAEVLNRLHGKNRPHIRIIVQDDLAENDVLIDIPNLTIEAEQGKTIHWKPASKPGQSATKLFAIHKVENVHIKGFVLDGEDRVEFLVNLFHHCPGVTLESLRLLGFKNNGIWVTNCEGGEQRERRIRFDHLHVVTTQPEQSAVFFSIQPGVRDIIPRNRFFVLDGCTFSGPGTAIKTTDRTELEHIEWPDGLEPLQVR